MKITKVCTICKLELPRESFYPNGAYVTSRCKSCDKERIKKIRVENKNNPVVKLGDTKKCSHCDKLLSYNDFFIDRSRDDGHCPRCKACEREYHRSSRKRNPNTEKSRVVRYYDLHKVEVSERRKKWLAENKHKALAHRLVRKAIVQGVIIKKPCEQCGKIKSYAHHDDYDKPLDVRWLCASCHMFHHQGVKN